MRYLIALLLCFNVAFSSYSQSVAKQTAIDYYDAVTGLTIKVERTGKKYLIRLTLPTQVVADLIVDDDNPASGVTLHVNRADKQAGFTRNEIMLIRDFSERGAAANIFKEIRDTRARDLAENLIAMLTQAPVGVKIDVSRQGRPEALSASLCHQGGQPRTATYSLASGAVVNKTVTVGKCYDSNGECLGRCGAGCTGFPLSTSRITQNCLNHDVCYGDTGSNMTPPCLDEFIAAVDDFANALDCASLTGNWVDARLGYPYKLTQSGSTVTGTLAHPTCGVVNVAGTHIGTQVALDLKVAVPNPDCCDSSTSGTCPGCDAVSLIGLRCGDPRHPIPSGLIRQVTEAKTAKQVVQSMSTK